MEERKVRSSERKLESIAEGSQNREREENWVSSPLNPETGISDTEMTHSVCPSVKAPRKKRLDVIENLVSVRKVSQKAGTRMSEHYRNRYR